MDHQEQPEIWRVVHETGISYDGEIRPQERVFVQLLCAFRAKLKELKGAPLAAFIDIALHMDENDQAEVGIRQIAEETGYSKTTIQGATAKLDEWIEPIKGSRGQRTRYQVKKWATRKRGGSVPLASTLSGRSVLASRQSVPLLPGSVPPAVIHDEELSRDIVVIINGSDAQKSKELRRCLRWYGILEPAQGELAQDSLVVADAESWMLYANDQKWTAQQRTGYVINRLRERAIPPTEYLDLVRVRFPYPASEGGYKVRAGMEREEETYTEPPEKEARWQKASGIT